MIYTNSHMLANPHSSEFPVVPGDREKSPTYNGWDFGSASIPREREDGSNQDTPITEKIDQEHALIGVFDGVGGSALPKEASRQAARTVNDFIINKIADPNREGTESEWLKQALLEAHDYISGHVDSDNMSRATTATVALIKQLASEQMEVHIAHVGDTRAYLIKESGNIQSLTLDQTGVIRTSDLEPLERWELQRLIRNVRKTREEVTNGETDKVFGYINKKFRTHVQIAYGIYQDKLMAGGALGKSGGGENNQPPSIETLKYAMSKRDRIMVCSDGIGNLTDEEIQKIIKENRHLGNQELSNLLTRRAFERSKTEGQSGALVTAHKDDISVTIIGMENQPRIKKGAGGREQMPGQPGLGVRVRNFFGGLSNRKGNQPIHESRRSDITPHTSPEQILARLPIPSSEPFYQATNFGGLFRVIKESNLTATSASRSDKIYKPAEIVEQIEKYLKTQQTEYVPATLRPYVEQLSRVLRAETTGGLIQSIKQRDKFIIGPGSTVPSETIVALIKMYQRGHYEVGAKLPPPLHRVLYELTVLERAPQINDFNALILRITKTGGINGSRESFSTNELIKLINDCQKTFREKGFSPELEKELARIPRRARVIVRHLFKKGIS